MGAQENIELSHRSQENETNHLRRLVQEMQVRQEHLSSQDLYDLCQQPPPDQALQQERDQAFHSYEVNKNLLGTYMVLLPQRHRPEMLMTTARPNSRMYKPGWI